MGDSSDGIPGIPKWGAKSSSTLLARYMHIEKIPSDHRFWDVSVRGASGLSKSLESNRDKADLYKKLATLKLDVPISQNVDDLNWTGADPEMFRRFCLELGMPNLTRQIKKWRT